MSEITSIYQILGTMGIPIDKDSGEYRIFSSVWRDFCIEYRKLNNEQKQIVLCVIANLDNGWWNGGIDAGWLKIKDIFEGRK